MRRVGWLGSLLTACGVVPPPEVGRDTDVVAADTDTANDDTADDDTADDDTANDDTANVDTADDDTGDDDTADDDTANVDTADDDTANDDTANDDTANDDTDTAEDSGVGESGPPQVAPPSNECAAPHQNDPVAVLATVRVWELEVAPGAPTSENPADCQLYGTHQPEWVCDLAPVAAPLAPTGPFLGLLAASFGGGHDELVLAGVPTTSQYGTRPRPHRLVGGRDVRASTADVWSIAPWTPSAEWAFTLHRKQQFYTPITDGWLFSAAWLERWQSYTATAQLRASLPDLDGDRVPDAWEAALSADPTRPDTDGDGLIDSLDLLFGDVASRDPDWDGVEDLEEFRRGTPAHDELSPSEFSTSDSNWPVYVDDLDEDDLGDDHEVGLGTVANVPDTDGDGVLDGHEIRVGWDPCVPGRGAFEPDPDGYVAWRGLRGNWLAMDDSGSWYSFGDDQPPSRVTCTDGGIADPPTVCRDARGYTVSLGAPTDGIAAGSYATDTYYDVSTRPR
jgi:hypothetical protein